MKRRVATGMALIGALLFSAPGHAVEDSLVAGMAEKGVHGLVNIATGWFELPMQIYKGYEDGVDSICAPAGSRSVGTLLGVFRGASHALGRTGWGILQLGGFWSRNPTTNEHLLQLLDATYAWEMGSKKTMTDPNIDNGLNRVGMRLERGLRNVFGAPLEIPGQLRKAHRECRLVGLPKGVWFMCSRIVHGTGDVVFFLLPGPEGNLNVPFEEIEGWDALNGRYYNNVK